MRRQFGTGTENDNNERHYKMHKNGKTKNNGNGKLSKAIKEMKNLGNTLDSQNSPYLMIVSEDGKFHCHTHGDPILQLGMIRVLEKLIFKNLEGLERD